jgi:hypothetical protein
MAVLALLAHRICHASSPHADRIPQIDMNQQTATSCVAQPLYFSGNLKPDLVYKISYPTVFLAVNIATLPTRRPDDPFSITLKSANFRRSLKPQLLNAAWFF